MARRRGRTLASLAACAVSMLVAGVALVATPARALDASRAMSESEAAIGRDVEGDRDLVLLDREGAPVPLSRYRGRPLLVSFVYTGCFSVCPLTTRRLAEAVSEANEAFGTSGFNVVTIGFNQPDDSPQAMKAFAANQHVGAANWDFLSAPAPRVDGLTRRFGFSYERAVGRIDHVLQVTMVDGRGRIVRQVYGDRPPTQDIVEPLRRLLRDEPLPARPGWRELVDRVRLLCTVYDPSTGRYRQSYALPLEIAGGLTFVFVMGGFFFHEWREQRRARARARGPGEREGERDGEGEGEARAST